MEKEKIGVNTICTHVGEIVDERFKGSVSPLYMATSYDYLDVDKMRYPRHFNTPNQEFLSEKIASLEHAEAAMIFGSGMAAISSTLLAFLMTGDHIVVQNDIYGGTRYLIEAHFNRFGIDYTFTKGLSRDDFEDAIEMNTRMIYIESPSNPLLKLVDIEAVADLASSRSILSVIDNTFATPLTQNPIDLGIDIVIHSATKYFGGHSDICAGAVVSTQKNIDEIWKLAKAMGGNLSSFSVWLLERSIKTLGVRFKVQQRNAGKMAKYLNKHDAIKTVYYPGLKNHPDHELAKKQMRGFGAMLSFDLEDHIDTEGFLKALNLIKPSMSFAGLESSMILPATSSHASLSHEERKIQGIGDNLIRFSLGIENKKDIIKDIEQALAVASMTAISNQKR